MEAMEHPYFYPIAKDQRINPMSGSPTAGLGVGGSGVPNSPIISPGTTPIAGGNQN